MMASHRWSFDRTPTPFTDAVIGSVRTRAAAPGYLGTNPSGTVVAQQQQVEFTPPLGVLLPPLRKLPPSATSAAERAIEPFQLRPSRLPGHSVCAPSLRPISSNPAAAAPCSQSPDAFQPADSPAKVVAAAVATLSISNAASKPTRKRRVSAKSEACREQCRTNQARYRLKQRQNVSKLESTVAQLREEIPTLEVQRRRLRYDSTQRVRDVVVEYFELFRHGVGGVYDEASSSDVLRASEAQQQLMFLRSTMAPDVEFGSVSGVRVLMEHWRRMAEWHGGLHFRLARMDKISDSIVAAAAVLSVTITKTTLERVFPHLMRAENVEDLSLAVKLLGHQVDYPCSVLFVWEEATSLVARVDTEIDMATPLLELLGNLRDVSRVVQGAAMAPNNYID
jgi:hypothetical protein